MSKRYIHNPAYLQLQYLLIELHRKMKSGDGESDAAYQLRDKMDDYWSLVDDDEIARLNGISADLYTLEPNSPIQHNVELSHYGAIASQLNETRNRQNWENALTIMRQFPEEIGLARATMLRGIAYIGLGEREVARLFLLSAVQFNLESYGVLAAFELEQAGYSEDAQQVWEHLLTIEDKLAPDTLLGCGNYLLEKAERAVASRSPNEAKRIFGKVIDSLNAQSSSHIYKRWLELAYNGLLSCYLLEADDTKTLAILNNLIELTNDGDYYAYRGLFWHSADDDRSLKDFQDAVLRHTSIAWAYFYIADECIHSGRYAECISQCDRALLLTTDERLAAQLYEWMAICCAETAQPSRVVLELFDKAIALTPSDDRLRENRSLYVTFRLNQQHLAWAKQPSLQFKREDIAFYSRKRLATIQHIAA